VWRSACQRSGAGPARESAKGRVLTPPGGGTVSVRARRVRNVA
jgi:hypothetical protein